MLILLLVTICACDENTINSPIQYVWTPYTGFALQPQHLTLTNTGNIQEYSSNNRAQEYRFSTGYHSHSGNNINLQNKHALDLVTNVESKTLPIDETVQGICENEGKKILAVWKIISQLLGLNGDHKIRNFEEVKRLSIIIKSFLTLSQKKDFNSMSIRQILTTIQEHLNDDSKDIFDTNQKPEVDVSVKDSGIVEGLWNKNFDVHENEINYIKNIDHNEDAALIENLEKSKKPNVYIVNRPPDLVKTITLQSSKSVDSSQGALNIPILNVPNNVEINKDTNSGLETNIQIEHMLADDSNSNIRTFEEMNHDKDTKIPYILASESGTNVLTGELPFNEVSKISSLLPATAPKIKAVLINVTTETPPILTSDFGTEMIAHSLINETGESLHSPSKSHFKALLIELSSDTPTVETENASESYIKSLFDKVAKLPSQMVPDVTESDKTVIIAHTASLPNAIVSESPLIVETIIPFVTPLEHIDVSRINSLLNDDADTPSIFGIGHTSEAHNEAVIIGEAANNLASQISESIKFVINEAAKPQIRTPIVFAVDSKSFHEITGSNLKFEASTHAPSIASDISESHIESSIVNEAVDIAPAHSGAKEIMIEKVNHEASNFSPIHALAQATIQATMLTPVSHIIEVSDNKPIISSEHISNIESMLIKENGDPSLVHAPEPNIKTTTIEDPAKATALFESSLIDQIPANHHSGNSLTVNMNDDFHFKQISHTSNDFNGEIAHTYSAMHKINAETIWQEIVTRYGSCTNLRSTALLIEVKALLEALETEECVFIQSQKTIAI